MIKFVNKRYEVYTRDGKELVGVADNLREALKMLWKPPTKTPEWVEEIERKRYGKVRKEES